jgi:hypothetical protein
MPSPTMMGRPTEDCQRERPGLRLAARLLRDERIHPMLTDHARVRFYERVEGWDVDVADRAIMTPTVLAAIRAGASGVKLKSGHWIRVSERGRIVTVMPLESKPAKIPRMKGEARPEREVLREVFREMAEGLVT